MSACKTWRTNNISKGFKSEYDVAHASRAGLLHSMAFPNRTITAYLFFIILVNMWTRAADAILVVKPEDTHLLAGKVTALNCSTSLTEGVHWYHGTNYVYAGRKLYSPYNYRVKVEVYQNDGTTAFNLVFPSAKPEDAGTYSCIDAQGRGEKSSAEMTVFTADGNGTCISNMKPDGVVIPNDCNIDPDEVKLSCSVTFYGKNPPQLVWRKVPEDVNSVANAECQTINNRVMCNTSIVGDPQMNSSSYVCRAAGSSQLNISLCSIPVKNLIYAFSGKTTPKSSAGNEVQCNSETSQSCDYKWKHSETVVSTNRAITPDRMGLYQCEAECNIRGKRCIVVGYVYISDEDSTSCSTGCVVGISSIIFIVILVILILIHLFLLKKQKGKRRQLPNSYTNERDLKMKWAQNDTQPEETNLVQLHERSETIADETKLIRTLVPNAASMQGKAAFGVAILGDELFVISHDYPKIEVFGDLKNLKSKGEISLTGHQLEIPWDIQSSSRHKCLYIVDVKKNDEQITEIIKIDRDGNVQTKWTTDCIAGRLSVTKYECSVIVTSRYKGKIKEYSPNGDLICSIEVPSDVGISRPWIALKRNENEYIISHGDRGDSRHGVCVINQKGEIKQYFGGKKGSSSDQLCVPIYMATYSDGHIIVVDKDNSRVVLLSPELKFITTLFSQGDYLRFPNRVCLDEQNKRLFVSDNQWLGNLKPWVDGKVLVFDMSSVLDSLNIALKKK